MTKATVRSLSLADVKISAQTVLKTGNKLFDEWFSIDGGMVLGTSIFVTGTSGAGKTTMMVNLMSWLKNEKSSMYQREMSAAAILHQTRNVKVAHKNAFISDKDTCPTFNEYMEELEIVKPKVVIIDSLQAIAMEDFPNMSIEDACNHVVSTLIDWTRKNSAILFLIGHNTKDGQFAGRNTVMQFMDGHIDMVHHKDNDTRTIAWGQKNRKGPLKKLFYTFEKSGIVLHENSPLSENHVQGFDDETFLENLNKQVTEFANALMKRDLIFKKTYIQEMKAYEKSKLPISSSYVSRKIHLIDWFLIRNKK
jgi:predicted ATP-dependent serine protease